MAYVLRIASVLILLILLACSGDDPTEDPDPTDASEPARTATPTAAPTEPPAPTHRATAGPTSTSEPLPTSTSEPLPTSTSEPLPTSTSEPLPTNTLPPPEPTPTEDAAVGTIAPLMVSDPESVESSLSETEETCLAESADHDRLLQLLNSPDLATAEEHKQLANCLTDEIVLRLFLTRIMGSEIHVGEETSSCLRSGLKAIDLRSIVLPSTTDEAQQKVSMALSLSAFLLTVSCLSEDEWAATAPTLDLTPADALELECSIDQLGGTEGLAAMLSSPETMSIDTLLSVTVVCESRRESTTG